MTGLASVRYFEILSCCADPLRLMTTPHRGNKGRPRAGAGTRTFSSTDAEPYRSVCHLPLPGLKDVAYIAPVDSCVCDECGRAAALVYGFPEKRTLLRVDGERVFWSIRPLSPAPRPGADRVA